MSICIICLCHRERREGKAGHRYRGDDDIPLGVHFSRSIQVHWKSGGHLVHASRSHISMLLLLSCCYRCCLPFPAAPAAAALLLLCFLYCCTALRCLRRAEGGIYLQVGIFLGFALEDQMSGRYRRVAPPSFPRAALLHAWRPAVTDAVDAVHRMSCGRDDDGLFSTGGGRR